MGGAGRPGLGAERGADRPAAARPPQQGLLLPARVTAQPGRLPQLHDRGEALNRNDYVFECKCKIAE